MISFYRLLSHADRYMYSIFNKKNEIFVKCLISIGYNVYLVLTVYTILNFHTFLIFILNKFLLYVSGSI
jgi:hypothetical protein